MVQTGRRRRPQSGLCPSGKLAHGRGYGSGRYQVATRRRYHGWQRHRTRRNGRANAGQHQAHAPQHGKKPGGRGLQSLQYAQRVSWLHMAEMKRWRIG